MREHLAPGENPQAQESMATVSMRGQALIPSPLGQAPMVSFGVKGSVQPFARKASAPTAGDDSSGEQVPTHVPHARLLNRMAPDCMLRLAHHRPSPV